MTSIPIEEWEKSYKFGITPWRREHDMMGWLGKAEVFQGTALDLGCGTGDQAIWLSQNGFEVEALDFSEEALRIARKEDSTVLFAQWDLEKLGDYPFLHDKYDLILIKKVIAFLDDQEKFLATVRQRLSGTAIVQVFLAHDEKDGIVSDQHELETLMKKMFEIKLCDFPLTRPGVVVADYYLK